MGCCGVFDTMDSVPRSEGKQSPLAALKRLARKLNVEIKFAAGDIHSAYAPESKYNISKSGRLIKRVVVERENPSQVYTIGRPVRWHRTEGGFKEPVIGELRGQPAVRLKALRPLAAGQAQQYGAPKGMGWSTVQPTEIKPGEKFHEQPIYERGTQTLKWKNYIRAQSEVEKVPLADVWGRHKKEVQELYAGERIGPRELRSKTIQSIQNQMQRHRDYMAGELRESLAIIRAKNASLESARAHPERMVEYKRRLSDLAKKQQMVSKSARERAGERLGKIAARGIPVIAEEHKGDWQSRLEKLNKNLKAATSPEETHNIQKQINEHFLLRKSPEDIKARGRQAVAQIVDRPYEHGGHPLTSEIGISTIQDVLQKGSRTSKPITSGRILKLKRKMDEVYERSASSGLGEVKKKILKERKIFTTPVKSVASGYPHLGKLGIGIGAVGLAIGSGLAIHAGRKYSRKHEMRSRLKEIRFSKFPISEEAKAALDLFKQAGKTGVSKSTTAIPGTWLENEKLGGKVVKPFSAYQIARQKWTKFIKAASGSKIQDLNPMDMKKLRALQATHAKNLGELKTLRDQLRTRENVGVEALKAQAERLGAQHAVKEQELFKKGHTLGREEGSKLGKARYEQQAGELTDRLKKESDKRAGRLKLIAAGTLAGGALVGYGLGRHDKGAYQRHEARQILNAYKPQRRQESKQSHPVVTIGISGYNGHRRREMQFGALDKIRSHLAGEEESGKAAHDIAIGAIEGGAAYPVSEYLLRKFAPHGSSLGRKIAVGGIVGGAATGLVGLGLSNILKGTRKIRNRNKPHQFKIGPLGKLVIIGGLSGLPFEAVSALMRRNRRRNDMQGEENMVARIARMSNKSPMIKFQSQRTIVARDRYIKQIHERDVDLANKYYLRAGLLGAGIGALSGKKNLAKAIVTGAGVGLGAQKAARLYGKGTRDQFGERSIQGKRVERAPTYIGTAVLAGYGLKRLSKLKAFASRVKLVQFQDPDEGPDWLQEWAHKKLYGRSYSTAGQVQKIKKYAGRTHRLVRDLNIKRQGLPNIDPRGRPRKNEWEKPWVAGALTTAALGAAIFGGKKAISFLNKAPINSRIGQLREGFLRGGGAAAQKVPGLGKVGGFYHGVKEELTRWRDKPLKAAPKYEASKFDLKTGKMKTAAQIERETSEASEKEFLNKVARGKVYKEEFHSPIEDVRFDDDPYGVKKKILSGGVGSGLAIGTYALMRHRIPLGAATPQLAALRKGAEKYGLARVTVHSRIPGRPIRKGPTWWQKVSTEITQPADIHQHIVEGSVGPKPRRFKGPVFDPDEARTLKSRLTIGQQNRVGRQINRGKLEEYKALRAAGVTAIPTTLPLTKVGLKRGYVAKPAHGASAGSVVTAEMIKAHNPNSPRLKSFIEHRRDVMKRIKDPNLQGIELKKNRGYKDWMTHQAINRPERFVQQRKVDIAKEYRVHLLGGRRLGVSSGRFGPGLTSKAETAAEGMFKHANPELKKNLLAADIARDTRGKWHIIETNPGAQSGFLAPTRKIDVRGPNKMYHRITGRYSKPASIITSGAVGAAGAGATLEATSRHKR